MSGLVTGLQNRLRRFESARHLTSERYPLPQRISFFFIPNRYFSRCGLSGRLGTPALDGVLAGVLAGVHDGAASSFLCVFAVHIHQIWSSLGTFRCSVEISRGKVSPKKAFCSCGHLRERTRTFEAKDESV